VIDVVGGGDGDGNDGVDDGMDDVGDVDDDVGDDDVDGVVDVDDVDDDSGFGWASSKAFSRSFLLFSIRSAYDSFREKNIGPSSASHDASTVVTVRIYSFVVRTNS